MVVFIDLSYIVIHYVYCSVLCKNFGVRYHACVAFLLRERTATSRRNGTVA